MAFNAHSIFLQLVLAAGIFALAPFAFAVTAFLWGILNTFLAYRALLQLPLVLFVRVEGLWPLAVTAFFLGLNAFRACCALLQFPLGLSVCAASLWLAAATAFFLGK